MQVCCLAISGCVRLLVPSCCDKSGTSCYHLVTRLMMVTDLLQVGLVTNDFELVNNLLIRADDIRLIGTTSGESKCHARGPKSRSRLEF
jgi:hypothetical protein